MMFCRIVDRVQMPSSSVIIVNAPDPLLLTDERKRHRARRFVEVDTQKPVRLSFHVGAAAGGRSLGLQGNALEATCGSQGAQKLIDKACHSHRTCNAL